MEYIGLEKSAVLAPPAWSAPSRVAARVARVSWGELQREHKLAQGVYQLETAGHGGVVAIIGVAPLEERWIVAARSAGLVERWCETPRGLVHYSDGRQAWLGRRLVGPLAADDWRLARWAAGQSWPRRIVEAWVGEEDAAFATIMLACPAARRGMAKVMTDPARWLERYAGDERWLEIVQRWHPEFLRAVGMAA